MYNANLFKLSRNIAFGIAPNNINLCVTSNMVTAFLATNFHIFDCMKTVDINTTLIEGYLLMLDNLSPSNKLDLISKFSASVKSDIKNKKSSFKKAFGAFQSEKMRVRAQINCRAHV